ncbi:MAG: hypothetical protein JWM87_4780 [Candidatus Eremiobacteraeota bacterium]|nr:hypothetical protein [Candidatus Eremiobacteraeota bacterium]
MSALGGVRDEVRSEWGRLRACWQSVRAQWTDEVADRFERDRWRRWEEATPAFLSALDDLDDVIAAALRDL